MQRLRQLSRRDLFLIVVVVVAAIGLLVFYKGASTAQAKSSQLSTEVDSAKSALQALEFQQQQSKLETQIANLKTQLQTSNQFPSRAQALALTSDIAATAAKQGVTITGFDSSPVEYADSSGKHPAIGYTMDASGAASSLVDTLSTATSLTSSIMQALKFSSATSSTSSWTMHAQLLVVYSNSGATQ